ncbi:HlyC/CorC family transporter [Pseudomonas sp. NA-150]|uniref:HlyC/CorC family transporter n=1 Tax=Pseudomonas sp. NA-150 TaxID=3367525 RepID=UPI0037C51016
MDNLPIGPMLGVLILLILWSGLLTAVEAAHHHLKATRRGSRNTDTNTPKLAFKLGSLILCNTLIKVLIVVMSTVLAVSFWHLKGPVLTCIVVGSLLLIFAEFMPRALAARYPDAILMLGNSLLSLPMKALYPLAWLFSSVADALLRPFGVTDKPKVRPDDDEIPLAVILQDNNLDHGTRSHVMSGIHALDSITVNDILVPRSEVDGISLDDSIESIIEQLIVSRHTRLPVYHNDINQVEGILNTRQIAHLLPRGQLTKEDLKGACYEPYFVPESTPLQLQLLNFHKQQRRLGVVVDEYGEVQGIVSLEDILEEIVGEFESEQHLDNPHIHPQADGRLVVDGAATIRELNKTLGWHLPSDGPKTLNGLVTEALETIPESSVCLKIGPYRLEILETEDNRVTRVMMWHYNTTLAVV